MYKSKFKKIKSLSQHSTQFCKNMQSIQTITSWFSSSLSSNGLFFSIRWFYNPPTTQAQLISKLHTMFNQIFNKLLGSHWFKLYQKHFIFIAVQEQGQSNTNFHAHVILGLKSNKFTTGDLINTLFSLQNKLQMSVSLKTNKNFKPSNQYPDNIVISPIFNTNGIAEYLSKEFTLIQSNDMQFSNTDNIIFDYQIFN